MTLSQSQEHAVRRQTSELPLARRPVSSHRAHDDKADKANLEAPSISTQGTRHPALERTKASHVFMNQAFKFFLYTQAERKHLKYSRLSLSHSFSMLNKRDHEFTYRGIETTCHQKTVGADFEWLALCSVCSHEHIN